MERKDEFTSLIRDAILFFGLPFVTTRFLESYLSIQPKLNLESWIYYWVMLVLLKIYFTEV